MILEFLAWIVFGALVGWVASIIMRTNENQGAAENIALGIVGALIGGFVMRLLGGDGITGFNLYSFLVALGGALALILLFRIFSGRSRA